MFDHEFQELLWGLVFPKAPKVWPYEHACHPTLAALWKGWLIDWSLFECPPELNWNHWPTYLKSWTSVKLMVKLVTRLVCLRRINPSRKDSSSTSATIFESLWRIFSAEKRWRIFIQNSWVWVWVKVMMFWTVFRTCWQPVRLRVYHFFKKIRAHIELKAETRLRSSSRDHCPRAQFHSSWWCDPEMLLSSLDQTSFEMHWGSDGHNDDATFSSI